MKNNKNLKILFLFLILVSSFLVIYRNVFLNNEVIIPGDIPYNTPVWQGEAPDQKYYKAENYLLSDQINQFYVWHHIAHVSMSGTGIIPLWNPYIFAGQPLVANSQSALFYPPNLLLFFLDPGTVATLRAFFNLFIIILFGYLLGRILGISVVGSVIISAALGLSGPVTVWLGHPHANVFSWFTFLMWSGEKIIRSDRKWLWAGIFSIGTGISILGGHPETVFHMLMVIAIYFFFRSIFSGREGLPVKKSSILLVAGLICGILIASIQLVPFSDFLFRSSTLHDGGRGDHGGPLFWSDSAAGNITGFATLVYPDFFGNPPDRTFRSPAESVSNYNEHAIYFGLIPLSFLIFILFRKRNPIIVRILAFISMFSLGIAWRLPIFEVFNHLPIFSIVANGRLKIFFVFISAILAGYGFDLFRKKFDSGEFKNRTILKFIIVPLTAILLFFTFSMIKSYFQLTGYSPFNQAGGEMPFFKYLLFKIFSLDNPGVLITLFTSVSLLIIVFLLIKGKMGIKVFEMLIVILCVVDLTIPAIGYNPTIKRADILPFPGVFSEFSAEDSPFRVMADDIIKLQNYNAVHGVHLMGGYDLPVLKKYGDLFLSQNKGNIHNHNWNENSELTDFLNVKYYFNKGNNTPVSSKFKLIFNNLNYRVYENLNVFPRAFMVYDFEVIDDKNSSLEFLKENDFRLRDKVLLPAPPEVSFKRYSSSSDVLNNVNFISYANDLVELEVKTAEDGILVMSDVLMPGWVVFIDGINKDILSANYAFRGVFIPAGDHIVIFKYKPLSLTIGMILTFAGLFIAALFILFGRREKRGGNDPVST